MWEISLPTNNFRQNQNPMSGSDARAQNINQVRLRKTTAIFNNRLLENDYKNVGFILKVRDEEHTSNYNDDGGQAAESAS